MLIATLRKELLNWAVRAEVVLAFVTAMAVLSVEADAALTAATAAISLVNEEILLMAWSVLATIEILLL